MPSSLELAANAVNALSIFLAGRNSAHTWWTGIIGCALFGVLFFNSQLYGDATLQIFFILTSAIGWWHWLRGPQGEQLPVRHVELPKLVWMSLAATAFAVLYAALLRRYTNAYQPLADSLVLTVSVLAQFLLMDRRVESWYGWLAVNTIAVPLFASRGLHLTAVLYAAFWVNALFALIQWRRIARAGT